MKLTNELGLPQPFVDAVTSSYRYKPKRYSVTEVLGGTCEAVLKRRHQDDITEDVSDMVWAIMGTAAHRVLQDARETDSQVKELWLSVPIGDYTLSGIFDLYDDSTHTVTDYKTCSVWKVQVGDFEDWRKQTLMYCWMLRQNGFDASRGEIVAIMRDHSIRDARTKDGYPRHPVMVLSWEFSDEDFASIAQEVSDWFSEVQFQERLSDDELEPCSSELRWHKPDRWAVMRAGQKRAVKLFDTEAEAMEHVDWLMNQASNKGRMCRVEFREGEDTKCESYCSVSEFCPFAKKSETAG